MLMDSGQSEDEVSSLNTPCTVYCVLCTVLGTAACRSLQLCADQCSVMLLIVVQFRTVLCCVALQYRAETTSKKDSVTL